MSLFIVLINLLRLDFNSIVVISFNLFDKAKSKKQKIRFSEIHVFLPYFASPVLPIKITCVLVLKHKNFDFDAQVFLN